jgi:hypothetical protein
MMPQSSAPALVGVTVGLTIRKGHIPHPEQVWVLD